MCNIPLITILFIAAQLSFAVSMGLVATAGALNASLFKAGNAPSFMVAAMALLGAAIASLKVAYNETITCASAGATGGGFIAVGPCQSPALILMKGITDLITTLSALVIAIGAATVLAGIPFAALLAVAIILTASLVAIALFIVVGSQLLALAACVATRPVPLPATVIIAGILGVLLAIVFGGLIITAIVGGLLPLVPFPLA